MVFDGFRSGLSLAAAIAISALAFQLPASSDEATRIELYNKAKASLLSGNPSLLVFASRDEAKQNCGPDRFAVTDVYVPDGSGTTKVFLYYCGSPDGTEALIDWGGPEETSQEDAADGGVDANDDDDNAAAIAKQIFHPQQVPEPLAGEAADAYDDFIEELFLGKGSGEQAMFPDLDLTRNPFGDPEPNKAQERKECRASLADVLRDLDSKITTLRNSQPIWGEGPKVDVGSCASRLRKLAGNFLCCQTFANYAPIWEEISCLELKRFYLERTCECAGSGSSYSTDEALQDGVLERYGALQKLRRKALQDGIQNPEIRAYVAEANEAIDCINERSLAILNSIEARLGYSLSLE